MPVMILYLAIGTAVFYMVGSSLSTAKVKQRELAAETVIEAEPNLISYRVGQILNIFVMRTAGSMNT